MDLSHNSINHLRARDFKEAMSLRTLNLSNNNLTRIDTGMQLCVRTLEDSPLRTERGGIEFSTIPSKHGQDMDELVTSLLGPDQRD